MSDYIKSIEEQIEELLKSDSDSVVDLVVQAQNYKELFEAKELSFDDYKELSSLGVQLILPLIRLFF